MCDNKNELHQNEYDKSEDYTSTRLDLDITETTDSYPEFDFLDLLRNLQVKGKKVKHKSNSEVSSNKSHLFSDEDSDVEALAKIYEEKYGTCNDYAELGEGYDEEDSFIDNSDVVNDLVPNGLQTEFGGFYINRGKLNFVKEDNSSSSTSEDVDKFLAHNRLNIRRIISDEESEEKESCLAQSNIQQSSANNNSIHSSGNNISSNNNSNNANNSNNHGSINNSSSLHNSVSKSGKRSRDYQHSKSKKMRKTATPKIPDHLLHKKPFPGSLEYRKNINEFKKNRLKTVESDKKYSLSNSIVNNGNSDGHNISHSNNINTVSSSVSSNNNNNNNNNNNVNSNSNNNNNNNNNNNSSNKQSEDSVDQDKKESILAKKKPLTVKELLKERDEVSEVSKTVGTGEQDGSDKRRNSSSSDSSESSSSDSDSYSSEDTPVEKEKTLSKAVEEVPPKGTTINGSISKDITAKSFAHLSDGLKELVAKVFEISKEEKNKIFNSRLNPLLLSLYDKLRELPMAERNSVFELVANILQMKKGNITKRIKKLLVIQEETKMSTPLRKLKDAVANIMPLLESNYFNEYTKAAGTSPQIYAELSRYYWSIDPSSLPQRKFPWNEELRRYLQEIVQFRKNCFFIIRPRKESLTDYIKSFLETKVKTFWPKEWMTVDILFEEAQVATLRHTNDKQKNVTKVLGAQNSSNITQKKLASNVLGSNASNRKQVISVPTSSSATSQSTNRKLTQAPVKSSEVKSILIPRKTPQSNTSMKSNFPSSPMSSLQSLQQGSRLQVTLNRLNVQEYLDRVSGSQTSIGKNPQQIPSGRSQQSVSPNRLVKTSSPNSILNSSAFRSSVSQKSTSPGSSNKSISSSGRNCSNQQSVLKTVSAHGSAVSSAKSSQNSVTISPVNESVFKDMSSSPEVLNLTKNSSVFISKVKDGGESRSCRSSSPSIGIPLPSGITISPTNASPSTFLTKLPKQLEKNSDVKIYVSITKQDAGVSLTKEKREALMNINVKREGPLQNIPDCISVTSKVVSNERPKYEHVRKRALQEYHQQHSPERLKYEEKKIKTEENLLADMEIKEDRFDEKNFSKIFDSVIAKTSETVRQSETSSSQIKSDRFSNVSVELGTGGAGAGAGAAGKNSTVGVSQFKSYPTKLRDVRSPKEKPFYLGSGSGSLEEKNYSDSEERNKPTKEQRVQMEMDRVMQNLVELSREKNPDYELGYPSSPTSSSGLKPSSFQEPYQKILFK